MRVVARAPGRINLIGDHTDYTGGLCFPMAIDAYVEVSGTVDTASASVRLESEVEDGPAEVPLDVAHPGTMEPPWARFVAAVVAEVRPEAGFDGVVTSTLPAGVGLSSSAALEVAVALALGARRDDPIALATLCQRAEHAARGVPTGILDQLSSLCGVAGHGLLLDCHALSVTPIVLPPDDVAEWVVLQPDAARDLARSAYAERVRELAVAEDIIGPLRMASIADVEEIGNPRVLQRARHVVTENERVRAFVTSIGDTELRAAGSLMNDSHRSLRDDFESSTATIDALWARLVATEGVFGARITGGGWGGCVIVLSRPGAVRDLPGAHVVRPAGGATVEFY